MYCSRSYVPGKIWDEKTKCRSTTADTFSMEQRGVRCESDIYLVLIYDLTYQGLTIENARLITRPAYFRKCLTIPPLIDPQNMDV